MTEALVSLPKFAQLSSRVWRILGLNPGKFTLQGTNTYLLGTGPQKILLDCGEGKPDYLPLLESSLTDINPNAYISDIIISHGHLDHWGGLPDLLKSQTLNAHEPIRIHKHPVPAGRNVHYMDQFDFPSTRELQDDQFIAVEGATLRVLYTPGHTADHCTFWLEEEQSLFTADCVLGQGTAVFDDLSEYIDGLQRLVQLKPQRLYPGHGPLIDANATAKIQSYIDHRLEREQQIMHLFSSPQDNHVLSSLDIVQVLYKEYPESLHLSAARGIVLHLLKLQKDGKLTTVDKLPVFIPENFPTILNAKWYLTSPHTNKI
ncbi:MAG: lactamase, beta 2 [Benjaminiella poitrasii]|nr:MAG: lactamase, beta 2 [Benjaminiella poitrasii]